ncbi:sialate O-acetylesterase [Maribellus sediminis]|uniref:sialate O-acetylesterase n=1 Tax=Maribellus sediminis TaxID=2696285 RepID=UPI001F0E80C7|nr:sialate O-acetylesterase [Maribellus sediminis]
MKNNMIRHKLFGKLMLALLLGCTILSSCGNDEDIKPILDVSTTSVSLPAEGGTSNITVTGNDQWSIANSAFSWLELNKTSGGSGNTEIQLTADLNDTGSTRSGVLKVSSQNGQDRRITVSQDSQDSPIEPVAQDRNFYIFLCFGQSNMHGAAAIESQDLTVDSRFKLFQALDCSNLNREKATWYTAVPPTCQCGSGLSPADYFGRTLVANLPDSITVGIINVSVAGCDIRLFDKDLYMDYDSTSTDDWFTSQVIGYDGNPYQYLINQAKLAQKDGVVKGILLHQGETNTGQEQWPTYVKKIYTDMLTDLDLDAGSVPLLAGELFSGEGNCCSSMNPIIGTLPDIIPTAHVISSDGCTGQDVAHFDSEGYRELGKRYGIEMLSILGVDVNE